MQEQIGQIDQIDRIGRVQEEIMLIHVQKVMSLLQTAVSSTMLNNLFHVMFSLKKII